MFLPDLDALVQASCHSVQYINQRLDPDDKVIVKHMFPEIRNSPFSQKTHCVLRSAKFKTTQPIAKSKEGKVG
jgi:hypothetical protein